MSARFRRSLPFEPGAWAIWQKNPDVSAHVGSCLPRAGRRADPESLLPGGTQGGPGQCQVFTNGETLTSGVCCRWSPSVGSHSGSNPPNIEPWRQIVSMSASSGSPRRALSRFPSCHHINVPTVVANGAPRERPRGASAAHRGGNGTRLAGARSREYARDALVAADENCPYSLGPLPALVSWGPGLPTADRPRKHSRGECAASGMAAPRPGLNRCHGWSLRFSHSLSSSPLGPSGFGASPLAMGGEAKSVPRSCPGHKGAGDRTSRRPRSAIVAPTS